MRCDDFDDIGVKWPVLAWVCGTKQDSGWAANGTSNMSWSRINADGAMCLCYKWEKTTKGKSLAAFMTRSRPANEIISSFISYSLGTPHKQREDLGFVNEYTE